MWRNKQNVFQELVVPVDNYNVLRRYSYLSCWYAYQHLKSTMGRDLGFCVYSIYAYNSYELLDKHLKLHSSSPVCISVCDVHTAFGFTVSLPSQTFIQQNLIPWIEIKDVGEVANLLVSKAFDLYSIRICKVFYSSYGLLVLETQIGMFLKYSLVRIYYQMAVLRGQDC